ncbi:RNA 2'-phosphotransferase [Brevibacillus sp. MER 51]|uniref:RNA 2'-phosphotransferase n=1 Tax=Brevibacillus sp. MER 51 TaxID=2939560 RepID=UPI00203CEA0A|nr:RNA 2'-phosphotransferase [Brevibacillus sp. MER 51]MCM3143017.1 RNA 2'-phosphotransferase [Brevibacillus sp. MER 51]
MDYQKLSKELSYALRHAPHEYELELDEQGWVPIKQLLMALHEQRKWRGVTEEDLHTMITLSEKKRHEINQGKIRALYGHSVPQKVQKEEKEPPAYLFHGTPQRFLNSILASGLVPKGRQYVHLSEDVQTAQQVGKRRDDHPVLLRIDARQAWQDGVKFYHGNELVWLADHVQKEYISVYQK